MPETKSELVQEYFDSRGHTLGADRVAGVLRGVKLLGLRSRNGRCYEEKALRDAISLYEGAKVNVNHPEGDPLGARDYRDRLGAIRNVQVRRGKGLYGDLHFNPKHALAEQLAWDAENAPENVGLSHNVLAKTRRDDEGVVVEAITRVQSVDLVADPATTTGLFEHETPCDSESEAIVSEAEEETPDRATLRRKAAIGELAVRHALALPARGEEQTLGESFLADLLRATDDAEVERLIAERARCVREAAVRSHRTAAPESREQTLVSANESDRGAPGKEAFVEAITRR